MKIKNILFFIAALFAFPACNDDTDPVLPEYGAIALNELNNTSYILDFETPESVLFTLNWTPYEQTQVAIGNPTFFIQVDSLGKNFESQRTFLQTMASSVNVTTEEFNSFLVNSLKLPANVKSTIQIRIVSGFGRQSLLFPETTSNVLTIDVTPYEAARPALHLVGDMFEEYIWNEKNYLFVMFRETPDALDTYTGWFKTNSEFKIIPDNNLGTWDLSYGSAGAGILSTDGGNIGDIGEEGYYTLTVDVENLSYTITPYNVVNAAVYDVIGIVGEFNNWSNDGEIFLNQASYDPHIWYLDDVELPDGELKFRMGADWAVSWGGDTFPYGGGSGNNIPVTGGKYLIKFNDLTGQYVFYSKD